MISTGASTTFRFYEQSDYAGARQFGKNGWLNDNVSSLSSSGFTQDGHGIDLLAPGDSSWATCTPNPDLYEDCLSFTGQPSDVERSGGTSESAPLTAGAAALVIQAYRQAHGGASPTPALIKQILVSTADDLTIPGDEQGAGRLDSYKAVEAAASVGSAHPIGATLLTSKGQLVGLGNPGSAQQWKFKVTNTGAAAQTVALSGRTFGPEQHVTDSSVVLSDNGPRFRDWAHDPTNYRTRTFTVAPGAARLNASIVYPGDPTASLNARVRLILVDPLGRYAAHSVPQGVGNYGHVDVRFPAAGTWTAVIFSRDTDFGGTVGAIGLRTSTQQTIGYGSVTPASVTLRPGQSRTVTVNGHTPASPGDASAAVVLDAGAGGQTSVPILLRSLVPLASGSGSFSNILTGGNGRQPNYGQGNYYAFDVPAGAADLAASVNLSADAADNVNIFLIDPNGVAQAVGTNKLPKTYNPTDRTGELRSLLNTDAYVLRPKPGRWTLSVNFAGAVVGNRLAVPFHGSIRLDSVRATATGLPTSGTLAAGTPVTVPVVVRNTGTAPQHFFLDARTDATTALTLAPVEPATVAVPVPGDAATPAWLVPSQTKALAIAATATQPIEFDYGPEAGDPDLVSGNNGLTPVGTVAGNPLSAGLWSANPANLGPTPVGGVTPGTATFTAQALTKGFDPAVSSPVDDFWRTSVAPSTSLKLITVPAGGSATIPVTITPNGTPGTVVRGTVYLDQLVVGDELTLNADNYPDTAPTEDTANQLAALPYRYRIG